MTILLYFSEAGAVVEKIGAFIYFFYLFYLFSVYSTRGGRDLRMGRTRLANSFGAATYLSVVLLVWSAVSLLWTPSPALTSFFFLSYLVKVSISYLLCKIYPILDIFQSVCKGTAYAAAATVPLAVILTGYSGGRLAENVSSGGVGELGTSFGLGILCVIYLISSRAISKNVLIVLMVCLSCGLYLAFCRTAVIAVLVTGMVYVLVAPGTWKRRITRIGLMAAAIAIANISLSSKFSEYLSQSKQAESLSGRTIIWGHTLTQILNGLWIRGFGMNAYYELGYKFPGMYHLAHAHNDFINVWFNLGLIGVVLLFGSYFALGYTALKVYKKNAESLSIIVLCFVTYYLTMGLTTAQSIAGVLPVPWLFLLDCLVSSSFMEKDRNIARIYSPVLIQQRNTGVQCKRRVGLRKRI